MISFGNHFHHLDIDSTKFYLSKDQLWYIIYAATFRQLFLCQLVQVPGVMLGVVRFLKLQYIFQKRTFWRIILGLEDIPVLGRILYYILVFYFVF